MAHLRCFVIVDGGYCGPGLDRTAERKDRPSATPESQAQGPDSTLAVHREVIGSKLMASQLLMQQLRDGLAHAQRLVHERDLIQRQLRDVVQHSRTIARKTHNVMTPGAYGGAGQHIQFNGPDPLTGLITWLFCAPA